MYLYHINFFLELSPHFILFASPFLCFILFAPSRESPSPAQWLPCFHRRSHPTPWLQRWLAVKSPNLATKMAPPRDWTEW